MVFSSSAQTVSISDQPTTFTTYSGLTIDEHIASLISDTTTSTSKTWSSQKSVNTFPQINDASESLTSVYSSSKVVDLIEAVVEPVFNIGTTTTLPPSSSSTVSVVQTSSDPPTYTFSFGITRGYAGLSSNAFQYKVDTVPGLTPPSSYFRYDNAVQINSTTLRFAWVDGTGVDISRFLLFTEINSKIIIQDATTSTNFQTFTVTGLVTTGSGGGQWITMPVSFSSSGGTGTSGFALDTQVLVGIQSVGQQGAQGSPGLSSSLFEYTLDRNSIVIGSGVGNGDIRFNNADLTLATTIWIDHLDTFGNDVERFVAQLADGSQVIIQDKNQSGNFVIYDVDSSTLVAGSYVALTVSYDSGAGLGSLVNNHPVFLALQFSISQTFAIGTTTTLSPGSSATVVNVGSQNDIILDFGLPQGATGAQGAPGAPGTSADLEFTIIQFSYYGSTPTANSFNLASGSITNAGGSLGIPTQSGSTRLTQSYRVRSNVASVANGAVTGWLGNSSSPHVFIGSGFKIVYSFGLEDTTTNALTRTFIGIQQTPSVNTLNNTTTVQSLTVQSLCIMQESSESTFSFYSRGASSFSKVSTTIPCTTPSVGWYTLVLHNQPGSNDVIMTLKYVGASVIEESTTFTCGTASAPLLTSACYVILQRNMSSAGGATGSAILSLGGVKMLVR